MFADVVNLEKPLEVSYSSMLKITNSTKIIKYSAVEFNKEVLSYCKQHFKDIRQKSKPISFACQYGGSERTLVQNCGFSMEEAEEIISNYKRLFKDSEEYKKAKIAEASKKGYVTGCFGLRARTPKLHHSLLGLKVTPKDIEAEGRTATNMQSQSFGMLTARAIKAFMEKVRNSPYRTKVRVCNIIHDAAYFLVEDDIDTFLWLNENLVKEFQWQEDPAIAHDKVHLGGEVSIFFPSWAHEIVVPNHCSREELLSLVDEFVSKEK